jgi:hypothetical protein
MKKFNVDEESVNVDLGKNQKPSTRKKKLITISAILGTLLIVVGLSVGIVFGVKKPGNTTNSTTTKPIVPFKSRVNCLPWLKLSDPKIKEECSKIPYCRFELNKEYAPSCFILNDLIKVNITDQTETKLGRSFTLTTNYGSTSILLEFEELDDNTLRFKV